MTVNGLEKEVLTKTLAGKHTQLISSANKYEAICTKYARI